MNRLVGLHLQRIARRHFLSSLQTSNQGLHWLPTISKYGFCTKQSLQSFRSKVEDHEQKDFDKSARRTVSPYVSKHFHLAPGEVESLLRRQGRKFYTTEKEAVVEECPFCHPTRGKLDNLYKLNIERRSGVYYCHRCKNSGSWFDFRKRTGRLGSGHDAALSTAFKPQTAPDEGNQDVVMPGKGTQEKYVKDLWTEYTAARSYLNNNRGLSDDVLERYGVGAAHFTVMDDGEWKRHLCITFPMFNKEGRLVRHKIRSIETKSGMRLEPKGGGWGFFGLDIVESDADEVVITEGEFDAMSVYQQTGVPAISLPNGANSLPPNLLPALERFKTIRLWMDSDTAGQDGAKRFSKKLGIHRCKSVINAECKDANDALREGIDMKEILDGATMIPHEALLRFDDLKQQVYSDLANENSSEGIKCLSIPALNKMLGGLRQGELTIFSGHTGIGKTTILSQLALDYCMQDVPTVWGSFEIPNIRLVGRILRQFQGAHGDFSPILDNFDEWANRFEELPMYFMRYHGAENLNLVVETMEYATYVYDCRHFVLDNLQFMTAATGLDRFEKLDIAVGMLREFCTVHSAHVSLVVHPRKEDDKEEIQTASVFGSAKATQEADNVIILQRGQHGTYLDLRKNRFSGQLGRIPLSFDRKRLLFTQDSSGEMGWAGKLSREHMKRCAQAEANKKIAMRARTPVQKGGSVRAAVRRRIAREVRKPEVKNKSVRLKEGTEEDVNDKAVELGRMRQQLELGQQPDRESFRSIMDEYWARRERIG